MTDAEKFDALVMTVMRGTHREARDMARARFVEMCLKERGHAEKVAREADALVSMHDRLEASVARCVSLEALVRELDEVVRLFNEDCEDIPSEWLPVRARCWVAMDKVNASPLLAELRRADLSHPLVSELTGEKEGGE